MADKFEFRLDNTYGGRFGNRMIDEGVKISRKYDPANVSESVLHNIANCAAFYTGNIVALGFALAGLAEAVPEAYGKELLGRYIKKQQ